MTAATIIDADADASAMLTALTIDNGSAIISNLPVGEYTLAEEKQDIATRTLDNVERGFLWTVTGTGDVSISVGEEASMTVTNTFSTDPVTLNKASVNNMDVSAAETSLADAKFKIHIGDESGALYTDGKA